MVSESRPLVASWSISGNPDVLSVASPLIPSSVYQRTIVAVVGRDPLDIRALPSQCRQSAPGSRRVPHRGGLFTTKTLGVEIEQSIRDYYACEDRHPWLLELLIPDHERLVCLKTLRLMNIAHLALFPDLYGASCAPPI
jgi:hypothetical protein